MCDPPEVLGSTHDHCDAPRPDCSAGTAEPVAWLVIWTMKNSGPTASAYINERDARDAARNVEMYAHASNVEVFPAAREKGYAAALENLKEAWSALAMIREAVETLAPSGSVKAAEHLDGPTFMHEAEALVAGIQAISGGPQTPSAPSAASGEVRTFDIAGTTLRRFGKALTITCDSDEIANKVAGQLRTPIEPQTASNRAGGK